MDTTPGGRTRMMMILLKYYVYAHHLAFSIYKLDFTVTTYPLCFVQNIFHCFMDE